MLTIAVGDIHGCHDKLVDLLARVGEFLNGRPHRLVFIGDYIDRGPNSREVVEALINLERDSSTPPICLMGNHEDMLAGAFDDATAEIHWLENGGAATLRSYAGADGAKLFEIHGAWLKRRPLSFDDGQRLYVHAGVDPGRPISSQRRHDLLWIREPFLSFEGDLDRLVVHGHTPTMDGSPEIRSNRINVDTGAVFGGPLTAAVFSDLERDPIAFLHSAV